MPEDAISAHRGGSRPSGPVDVVVVDAEDADPPPLSTRRADGSAALGAWLVVRSGDRPVGVVEVAYEGRDRIPSAEVVDAARRTAAGAPARPPAVEDAALPSVTVVVPTAVGRPAQLRGCLSALDDLDHPDYEVVVVDNRRTVPPEDPLAAAVVGLTRVRTVRQPVPGISAARNAGVAAARGEVVAFTDDDVRVDRAWLRALASRFARRPDEDAVTGLILPAALETDAQLWFERHYGGFGGQRVFAPLTYRGGPGDRRVRDRARVTVTDDAGAPVRRFAVYGAGVVGAGANMAFRASALARLGPFDTALGTGTPARGGEDLAAFVDLLWQGGAIGYEPSAVVFHTHREDVPALRDQLHAYGLGFTAMLTSCVLRDPRHLAGIASQVPAALTAVLGRTAPVAADGPPAGDAPVVLGPPPPTDLAGCSRRGLPRGPGAYLRSRWGAAARTRRAAAGGGGAPLIRPSTAAASST